MGSMITYACQLLFGLFALTHGQTLSLTVTGGYVNKTQTASLVCSLNNSSIADSVNIYRNIWLAFSCPIPGVCNSQGLSSDYTITQTVSVTTVTITNANKDRDGVMWTCRYGSVQNENTILNVVTPASSIRIVIEETKYIILELICTNPYTFLDLTFYLGANNYTEGILTYTASNRTCASAYEASVNYTLTFPSTHVRSYNGIFNVFVNNGFYITRTHGSKPYSFTATTRTTMATTTTTMTTVLNITLTLSGTQTFSTMTSSNAQIVSTQNSSVSTLSSSDTQTFPVIPVVIGVAVFILLIVIVIICRCCYLYRHKKEICTKQQNESELEVTKNPTYQKMELQFQHISCISFRKK